MNRILSLLKELIVVTLGILIALGVNRWSEQQKDERFIQAALTTIAQEIAESKVELDSTIQQQEKIRDQLFESLENEDSTYIVEITAGAGGLPQPELKDIGINYLTTHRAELLDYELITYLSNIQFNIEQIDRSFDKLADNAYSLIYRNDEEAKYELAIRIGDLINGGQNLLTLYEEDKVRPFLE
ncbi:MAG: hypothetical protein AAGI23_15190 [Bacteroidota bacterium]